MFQSSQWKNATPKTCVKHLHSYYTYVFAFGRRFLSKAWYSNFDLSSLFTLSIIFSLTVRDAVETIRPPFSSSFAWTVKWFTEFSKNRTFPLTSPLGSENNPYTVKMSLCSPQPLLLSTRYLQEGESMRPVNSMRCLKPLQTADEVSNTAQPSADCNRGLHARLVRHLTPLRPINIYAGHIERILGHACRSKTSDVIIGKCLELFY